MHDTILDQTKRLAFGSRFDELYFKINETNQDNFSRLRIMPKAAL